MPHFLLVDKYISDYDTNKDAGKKPLKNKKGLAKAMKVSSSTVTNWCDSEERTVPTITMGGKLAKFAGIDYNDFVKNYMR